MTNEDKAKFEIYVLLQRTPTDRLSSVNYNYYLTWQGSSVFKFLWHIYKACKMSRVIKMEWRRL